MIERVESGGMKSFSYDRNYELKLDDDRRDEIVEGYEKYYKRREKMRKRKILAWSIIVIILVISVLLILRFT